MTTPTPTPASGSPSSGSPTTTPERRYFTGEPLGDHPFDPYQGSSPFPELTADGYTSALAQAWNLNFLSNPDKRQPNQKMAGRRDETGNQGYQATVTGDPENRLRFVECYVGGVGQGDRLTESVLVFLRDCVARAITGPEGAKALAWLDTEFAALDVLYVPKDKIQRDVGERFGWARIGLTSFRGIIVRIRCGP